MAFTKRLKSRVAADAELSGWLTCSSSQRSLMPGMPGVHQSRWSVQIVAPKLPADQAWYTEFVRRWREYSTSLLTPFAAPQPSPSTPSAHATPPVNPPSSPSVRPPCRRPLAVHPRARKRPKPSTTQPVEVPPAAGPPARPSKRARSPSPPAAQSTPAALLPPTLTTALAHPPAATRPAKRQCTLAGWLRPQPDPAAASSSTTVFGRPVDVRGGHGRATSGPPT